MTPGRRGRVLVVKGAPEHVLAACIDVPEAAHRTLDALFADGRRVVAVAAKPAEGLTALTPADEAGLSLVGFLTFADNPKAAARDSLARLAALEIEVKVATGDNPQVAEKVCAEIGLVSKGTVTGVEMDDLDDAEFDQMVADNTIFARITPEQKARLSSRARKRADPWASWVTGSTTRWRCTLPTSVSRSIRPPTSPRTPPTWCCWKRTSACSPTVWPRAGASSPTPSSTY